MKSFRVPHGRAREYADMLVAAGYLAEASGEALVTTDAPAGVRIHIKQAVAGPFSLVAKRGSRIWLVRDNLRGLARAQDDARTYALAFAGESGRKVAVYIVDGSHKAIGVVTSNPGHYIPLTPNQKVCASKYISEEVATEQYPRKQAVAIGINRARRAC